MTPAVEMARKSGIVFTLHEYDHDPTAASYGEEAAEKLGLQPEKVFKTLVVTSDGKTLFVAVVPVSQQLDLKACAKALGVKKLSMAEGKLVERTTGYVLGGVSPLGQKKRLRTIVDASAGQFEAIWVSAGRRGVEIELSADDLCTLTGGQLAPVATPN